MINDVNEFFSTDDFAEEATYTNPAGVPSPILVIFSEPSNTNQPAGLEYASTAPSVLCRSIDVLDADTRSTIALREITYHVTDKQADGTGITTLFLSKD